MLGYKREDVEKMAVTLNYALHHHLPNTKGENARFVEEDSAVLRQLEDFINGLLHEGRV
jgi:hypothetical protein